MSDIGSRGAPPSLSYTTDFALGGVPYMPSIMIGFCSFPHNLHASYCKVKQNETATRRRYTSACELDFVLEVLVISVAPEGFFVRVSVSTYEK
ncbi:hypothetical protein AVEN_240548-1 [Araneus ventricosus]|uniref:Uncharacterized protein n=1 Tax=Araneus ventricosus TaxID=182803 RepID=A0A4Y2TAP6_ARAVE|nr:hypothetical protein AVEN_240548-1 [Araneus ventricosus]